MRYIQLLSVRYTGDDQFDVELLDEDGNTTIIKCVYFIENFGGQEIPVVRTINSPDALLMGAISYTKLAQVVGAFRDTMQIVSSKDIKSDE